MPKKMETVTKEGGYEIGRIDPRSIVDEMQTSYLDYAMSVIVARALPDVRDGLKPVHRRILYAMWDIGLRAQAKYRKSATVVGEVLGKYHPHGDMAVYDSLVRMAQTFSMRYPLVNGQGNFGSMDGDSAAAMRYTECKLARAAEEMLFDIDKETVDFYPNYDGSQQEPRPLPAKLPNFLLNGTLGIAVGMATNVPPHNLNEICDGITHLIDNPEATVEDLMEYIKGPDFPTGGIIYNVQDIQQAYATGKGGIVMRARAEVVEEKNGKYQIIVTEIPYQVNKATLLEKIAELVQEKRLDGISGLRDESDKDGVRVVVELKKDAYPQKVLNQLFKLTPLQEKFHMNMLALVEGGLQPRVLTLKMVLEEYIKHRKEVVRRRAEYELAKAKARAHILEGLVKALDHIDEIIKLIKASRDRDDARTGLIKKFTFTELQANAILDMRLHQLAHMERQKLEDELKEKKALIRDLEEILAHVTKILGIIKGELQEMKSAYGDERRTQIVKRALGEFTQEDLIPNEEVVVMMTRDGYIKRMPADTFKIQGRGGKGVIGLTTKEEDEVGQMFSATTHSDVLFFTTRGRVFQLKAYDIPSASRTAKGQAIVNFLQLGQNEKVSVILPLKDLKGFQYLVMVTKHGVIKRVDSTAFKNVRQSGLIAVTLKDDDMLQWVRPSKGKDDIILITLRGVAIRFSGDDVRSMGRTAAGVRGIRMKQGDVVVGMDILNAMEIKELPHYLLVVMTNGHGKRTNVNEYKVQGRGGAGIKTANVSKKTGEMVSAMVVKKEYQEAEGIKGDLVIISSHGQVVRIGLKSVPVLGRATQGVRLMRFKEANDTVASVMLV